MSLSSRWRDVSVARKLYVVVGIMGVLIVCELLTLRFAMRTLSAGRAFVGGEGLWSKAQKNALIDLQRFGRTRDEADYAAFVSELAVPEGDHLARLELLKAAPDRAVIHRGFRQGRIDDGDIDPMIDLLRRFAWTPPLARAVEVWTEGDALLDRFRAAGAAYHDAIVRNDAAGVERAAGEFQRLNRRLTEIEDEFSYELGDGSRWLEWVVLSLLTIAVLIVETIGLTLAVTTARGISRELAELEGRVAARTQELAHSRDQLGVILEAIADGITVIDADGKFVYANEAGARMCGAPSVQAFLETPQQWFFETAQIRDEQGQPLPREQLPSRLAFAGAENPPERVIRSRLRNAGEERWFLVRSAPVFDAARRARLVVTISKDVTDHKRAEDALKFLDEASQILASSMDWRDTLCRVGALSVPRLADWCAIDVLEQEGTPALTSLFHSDPGKVAAALELRRRYPTDPNAPFGPPRVIRTGEAVLVGAVEDTQLARAAADDAHLEAMRAVGIGSVMMVPLVARGKIFGALTLVAAESKRRYGQADLSVATELARRAGTAIENATLYQMAQRAIHARDEFLSIASHELKTPLTSLGLQLELMRQKIDLGQPTAPPIEKIARVFEVAGKQVDRLTRLVEDLLDVSRIEVGKLSFHFERLDLGEVVRGVVVRFAEQLTKAGSALALEIEDHLVGPFDQIRVEQVVDNLLSNAVKYASGKPVTVSLCRKGDSATLVVEDHGPGIPAAEQARIFERFERGDASSRASGLGLGLFIAKEIVQGHGGSIRVESPQGTGSRFVVELPVGAS